VNPDLSGLYGATPVKKIDLEGNQVSFRITRTFGDQEFESNFKGTLNGRKLTGELVSSRGSRKVTGLKRGRTPAKTTQIKKLDHKPDVIFVPTPPEVVDKMLELAQVKKDDLLYDLGCGDGRIVVTAAKKYGCRCVGYDVDPKRIKESLENVEKNNVGDLVRIEQEDIFTLDLSKANVITLYLLPSLNVKLIPQLEKLKPGSRIVSHDFDMRGVTPDKIVKVNSDNEYSGHTIYFWTTPLKKEDVSDE
jgi:precorrin-6B methylase 2